MKDALKLKEKLQELIGKLKELSVVYVAMYIECKRPESPVLDNLLKALNKEVLKKTLGEIGIRGLDGFDKAHSWAKEVSEKLDRTQRREVIKFIEGAISKPEQHPAERLFKKVGKENVDPKMLTQNF